MMEIQLKLNGRPVRDSIDADTLLIDFVRAHGCASVKRGCVHFLSEVGASA